MKSPHSFQSAAIALASVIALTGMTLPAQAEPGPVELIDALNGVFGQHAGLRSSHAKGFCAVGKFIPDSAANTLIASAMFAQPEVSAIFRFSIGGGNPAVSDKSRSVRGLAVKLESGSETYDLALVSEPVFFAATPASFVSFLQARVADPATKKPNPEKIKQHSEQYPESNLLGQLLAAHAAPASYATTPYFSNHAFHFENGKGGSKWARILMEPNAGTRYLTESDEQSLSDNFLKEELQTRLGNGAISYTFYLQEAAAADSLTDPTQPWSQSGAKHRIGKLEVSGLAADHTCDTAIFSPTQLPEGISPADDPILKARGAAYVESFRRRTTQ